jgi:methanogenic corrinoid protein MtbC1
MDRLREEGRTESMPILEGDGCSGIGDAPRHHLGVMSRYGGPAGPGPGDLRQAHLAGMLEAEIIPRLMRAQVASPGVQRAGVALDTPDSYAQRVEEFSQVVLASDVSAAIAYVRGMRGEGFSLEALCLGLLAPTARRLGELWEDDLCDFSHVTMGLWRLQQVLREFSDEVPAGSLAHRRGLQALLLPAPGEQHTFGLSMVMQFFRRAGWDVWGGSQSSVGELRKLVRGSWFDVIGFSISSETRLERLAYWIRSARRASRNPSVAVLVGGKAFSEHPELMAEVGADLLVTDGHQAPFQAEQLLANSVREAAR